MRVALIIGLVVTVLLSMLTVQVRAQKPELVVQTGHSSGVNSVVFSPNGKMLASGGKDNTIKLWEVATGRELRTLSGHSDTVRSVAFSADGRTLASGSEDNTVKLWEVVTGSHSLTLTGHSSEVTSVAFSPDGKTLASGSMDRTIRLWHASTGRELRRLTAHSEGVCSIAFSPDGKSLASGSWDETIKLWGVETGRELRTLSGHSDFVPALAYSSDGKVLASGSADGTIKLWDVGTGRQFHSLTGHSIWITSIAFSADGKALVTGGSPGYSNATDESTINLWDVATGRELYTFRGFPNGVESVAFSSDGKTLAGSGETIRLWDVATRRELRTLRGHSHGIESLDLSADGETLATSSWDNRIRMWNLTNRELHMLEGHSDEITSVVFSADGKTLASGSLDRSIKLWEVATGRELGVLEHSESVHVVAYSPDQRILAGGGADGTTKLWDLAGGRELFTLKGHWIVVDSLAFSADGKTLATGSRDQTIKVWEVATGRELRTLRGHSGWVESLAFSADGKTLASGGRDNKIKFWDVATANELRTLAGHSHDISSLWFSPDGKTLASGSNEGTIKLWEVSTGRELRIFPGHSGRVSSIVLSRDLRFLISGSYDASVKLWRIDTGELMGSLIALDEADWTVVMPDGRFETNNLEEIKGLHWVMPDDPMKALPLEIFMRDYYEPRLLPRILGGEQFPNVRDLSLLNRVQPQVEIKSILPAKNDPSLVTVTVEVAKAAGDFKQGRQTTRRETEVYDVRLFRDGQLVGQSPEPTITKSGPTDLNTWRQSTQVRLDANGRQTIRFENIRLPRKAELKEIEFSAYAFNEDRVKSQTDKKTFAIPSSLKPRAGRTYLISVGVNSFESSDLNLQYAANDARVTQELLTQKLIQTKHYEEVVQIPLISDAKEKSATKANFKAVLDLLSGKEVEPGLLNVIPAGAQIKEAHPEDLVVISFSSHGYTDVAGTFYLFPTDTGQRVKGRVNEQRLISSDELSLWLKDVDAGEMVMIVDACHAAAAIDGSEFKPGPMGSRGLGQLSYDKGMRILTATQAANVAIEVGGSIGHGLLTYALVKEGLEQDAADFKPRDQAIHLKEWLEYGVDRVPSLYDEILTGRLRGINRAELVGSASGRRGYQQQPSLFDFSRKDTKVVLTRIPVSSSP